MNRSPMCQASVVVASSLVLASCVAPGGINAIPQTVMGGHGACLPKAFQAADPAARDMSGATPLHWAALAGCEDATRELLARGADPNAVDSLGNTPLHWAVNISCIIEPSFETFNLLWNRGQRVPSPYCYVTPESSQQLQVWRMAHRSSVLGVCSLLMGAGAAPDVRNARRQSPLQLALDRGFSDAVATLVASGARCDVADDRGDTPLHLAARFRAPVETAQLLLEHGADLNAVNLNRETPLHVAARANHLEFYDYLVKRGACESVLDGSSQTASGIRSQAGK